MRPGSEKEGISRIVLGTVIGCGCGLLLCCLLLLVISAAFVSWEKLPYAALEGISLVVSLFGGILAGFVGAKIVGRMGLIAGVCSAAAMLLILSAIGLVLAGSGSVSVASALTRACALLLSGAIGGMIATGQKQKIRRRK